jgi:hypothetical protein
MSCSARRHLQAWYCGDHSRHGQPHLQHAPLLLTTLLFANIHIKRLPLTNQTSTSKLLALTAID